MCCFHYSSLAPPRRRFIIVLHSSMFSLIQFFRANVNVAWRVKHQHWDWHWETKHWRWCDEWKLEFSPIEFSDGKSQEFTRQCQSIRPKHRKSLRTRSKCGKWHEKREARSFPIQQHLSDSPLLSCQFWHLFSTQKKKQTKRTQIWSKQREKCWFLFRWIRRERKEKLFR